MKNQAPQRQQEPTRRRFLFVLFCLLLGSFPCHAQDEVPQGICRFTLALPEMEGPLTLGIFLPDGVLTRLLENNAALSTIPAGLNGLLIDWDGKDNAGVEVPSGTYHARGLVHGAVGISALPSMERSWPGLMLPKEGLEDRLAPPALLPPNEIVVRAAPDALLLKRPLLHICATVQENTVVVAVEGLPLFSLTLGPGEKPVVELRSGSIKGTALLILHRLEGNESYTLSGLDQLVPLDAGTLEIPSDTFHSPREAVGNH